MSHPKESISKNDIIKHVVDVYSSKLVSPSLELHVELFKVIQRMHASKTDAQIQKELIYIKDLKRLNCLDLPSIDITLNTSICKDTILDILSRVDVQYHRILEPLKESVISDETFTMFSYMYNVFYNGGNVHTYNNCRQVISWLLLQTPKKLFKTTQDVMAIVYELMIHAVSTVSQDIKKYVVISRELSSFKASKAHAQTNRWRLLTMTMYVVITRQLEYNTISKPIDDIKNKYLFVVCQKDMDIIHNVKVDRHRCKQRDAPCKRLQIEDACAPQRKDSTDIVKMAVK